LQAALLGRNLLKWPTEPIARVIDDDVNAVKGFERGGECGVDICLDCDVKFERQVVLGGLSIWGFVFWVSIRWVLT
jgi:hypothetical protein